MAAVVLTAALTSLHPGWSCNHHKTANPALAALPSAGQMDKARPSVGIRTTAEGGLGTDRAGILEPSLRLSRSGVTFRNEGKGPGWKGVTSAKPEGAEQL